MKEKYEIFKTIYLNYMPDFVVGKEKVIKAKLQVEGFLEKWYPKIIESQYSKYLLLAHLSNFIVLYFILT